MKIKILIVSFVVILLGVGAALRIYFMPAKSEWADDYSQYASTLANDDPLYQTLEPMLADGELSIWEISGIHCGEAQGCRVSNVADILLSPESGDMFAQTVLATLKYREE